jgi:hypothetical protein
MSVAFDNWYPKASKWIEEWANKEYQRQTSQWLKTHKNLKRFRFTVTKFHEEFITALGQADEEKIKLMMMFPQTYQY